MWKRLLPAVPAAACVVIVLFAEMGDAIAAQRARVEYTIRISDRALTILKRRTPCDRLPPGVPCIEVSRPTLDEGERPAARAPRQAPAVSGRMPREEVRMPKVSRRDLTLSGFDPCAESNHPILRASPIWPREARDGDYAVVEYVITAQGNVTDIKVARSSNPKINDGVLRNVRRWRFEPNCVNDEFVDREPERRRIRIEFSTEEMKDADHR